MKIKTVYFKTFGCRTNQFDTQVMIKELKDYKVTLQESEADVIVVNSCTVTNGADSSVRNYINRVKKDNKKIILTGCGALSKGEELLKSKSVNGVFGHSQKKQINKFLSRDNFYDIGDLKSIDNTIVSDFIGKSRAFIKIQEGCDFECSYCIIPSVRGKARSHSIDSILSQIKILAQNGFGEFILTGTNVGSYGVDLGVSIARLLKQISLIKGVRRVRVGSLEPMQIDNEFLELLGESWMAKHLHIALQHTNNKMLKIMKRRNRFESDLELFEKISSKGYALGTDYIVAHPGESNQIWSEALNNFKKLPITHIHPFRYSKRDNTHSATLKQQVNGKISKARLNELKEIIRVKNINFRRDSKSILDILVESQKNQLYYGYDQFYNKVTIKSNIDIKSTWVQISNYEIMENSNEAEY